MNISGTSTTCRDLHSLVNYSEICAFVKQEPTCHPGKYVNILALIYCSNLPQKLIYTSIIPMITCLAFLFVCIAVCVDEFFCPVLAYISNLFHLSDNVAGVTLLALGNGAPDIISAGLAVISSRPANSKSSRQELGESTGLAFGALLGAASFICTNVVGLVSIVCPFKSIERPLLRDVVFLLVASYFASTIIYREQVHLFDAIALLAVYGCYVIFIIFTKVAKIMLQSRLSEENMWQQTSRSADEPDERTHLLDRQQSLDRGEETSIENRTDLDASETDLDEYWVIADDMESNEVVSENEEVNARHENFESCLHRIFSPFDSNQNSSSSSSPVSLIGKVYIVIKYVPVILFRLSCPQITLDAQNHNWNRVLNSLHCFLTPLFASSLTGTLTYKIGSFQVPLAAILLPIGFFVGCLTFAFSYYNKAPRFVAVFALVSFPMSMIWIYLIAENIVNILNALGVVLNVSPVLMGITLLAFGNSMADSISDVVMARKGKPNMAITACYAGPLLNILLGMGLPLTYLTAQSYPDPLYIPVSLLQTFVAYALVAIVAMTLIIIPLIRFRFSKPLGISFICLYVCYLAACITIELKS